MGQAKTETERAQAALDVSTRRVAKLEKSERALEAQLGQVRRELAEAEKVRDYRAMHPALPKSAQVVGSTTVNDGAGTGTGEGTAGA